LTKLLTLCSTPTDMQTVKGTHRLSTVILVMVLLILPETSCMKDAPESLPDKLIWNPALAFPVGEESYGLNDVSGFDTTLLDLDTITGLPEWVDQLIVEMKRNLDFDLSSIQNNLDQIHWALFRVSFENEFPDVIFAQGYFKDEGENVIDSMFSEGPVAVPAANVAESGEVLQTGQAIQDAYFDHDRIAGLNDATHIALRAFFIVTDPDSALIPHYPDFAFNVHIGVMLDLTVEF